MKNININTNALVFGASISLIGSNILTARSTMKIADDKYRDLDAYNRLSNADKVKKYWKYYIPSASVVGPGIASVIKLNAQHVAVENELSRLVGNAAVTMSALKDLAKDGMDEDKYAEFINKFEKEASKMKEDVDRIMTEEKSNKTLSAQLGRIYCGNVLDSYTGQTFTSDRDIIINAAQQLNGYLVAGQEQYVTLSEFLELIGGASTIGGDCVGWNASRPIDISFGASLDNRGAPILVISYNNLPEHKLDLPWD